MKNQLTNIISTGITFLTDFIREEDLMLEALITLAVLFFLIIIM